MAIVRPSPSSAGFFRRTEEMVIQAGQVLLGMSCILLGVAACTTLILIPVGLPIALVGVAILLSAGEGAASS